MKAVVISDLHAHTEVWKSLPDYEERYEVSDLGRVRVKRTKKIRAQHLVPHHGYSQVVLWDGSSYKTFWAHRLVLLTFVGEPASECETLHLNGVRHDNRLVNLRWGTRTENLATRRIAYGVAHGNASLTPDLVRDIRNRLAKKQSKTQIAKELGVGYGAVRGVAEGRTWKHVQ